MRSLSITLPLHSYYAPGLVFTRSLLPAAPISYRHSHKIRSNAALILIPDQTIVRRSADYKPPTWTFDRIQSLKTEYVGESYIRRIEKLKEEVRAKLEVKVEDKDSLHQLELIDNLQRLGISYHFENEIKNILDKIYTKSYGNYDPSDLYATALEFRILRHHGYFIPQEIFNGFIDESGNFKEWITKDYKGMLYLYEASFLSVEGESILDSAKDFTRKNLKEYVRNSSQDPYLSTLINHALELPLHWRMLRMEANWFIQVYHQNPDSNSTLLDLAKLDYNVVQATYQEDLKHASRWWKRTSGFGEKFGFARSSLVENLLWAIGISFGPQYEYYRRVATQIHTLMTIIDDIYDVYGTLDELELWTDAVQRWDINRIDNLPEYMKLCFFGLQNSVNQMAADIFRDQGYNILPYTKKVLTELCKAYFLEANWYHNGYKPTLQEYIDNAVTSVTAPVLLHYAYVGCSNQIKTEDLKCFEKEYPNFIRYSAMITRLTDDLGTSPDEMKRGDVPKSVQCYMNETGASEAEALEYVWRLIDETWKKLNKEQLMNSSLPRILIEAAVNLGRTTQFMYLYGDGHSSQAQVTRDQISSLIVNPIS